MGRRVFNEIVAVMIMIMFIFVGCGTIFTGTRETIQLNSTPSGAKVVVEGMDMGETPTSVTLKRNKEYVVSISKDGYGSKQALIDRNINGVFWVNIIVWPGLIVDLMTGGGYDLTPDVINIELNHQSP